MREIASSHPFVPLAELRAVAQGYGSEPALSNEGKEGILLAMTVEI